MLQYEPGKSFIIINLSFNSFFENPSLVILEFHFQEVQVRFNILTLPDFITVQFTVVMINEHVQFRCIEIVGFIREYPVTVNGQNPVMICQQQ